MKRTLYPKLLAGYLMYGLIGFLIITTFTYHITFAFVEKKGLPASTGNPPRSPPTMPGIIFPRP